MTTPVPPPPPDPRPPAHDTPAPPAPPVGAQARELARLVRLADRRWTRTVLASGALTIALPSVLLALGHPRLAASVLAPALGCFVVLVFLAEVALRQLHPPGLHGREAPWRHPWRGPVGRGFDVLANSRLVGVLCEPLPELAMRSDIRDVVYVNYLVEAARLAPLVPRGLALQRLGPQGRWALFTFLTYRHGHFGFRAMGALRRLLPSPVQTNWRIHVRDPRTGHEGIYFVTNAIEHTLMALAARLTTRGMPMHVPARTKHRRTERGVYEVEFDPGHGSAPDLALALEECDEPALTGPWAECWPDWDSFLAYCVQQDRAMATQPEWGEVSRQEIDLGITPKVCVPLAGTVRSEHARAIVGDAPPLCFRVPAVGFNFELELHDALGP